VTGFADYNIGEDDPNQWVIEPQVNFKLNDRLRAVVEYRFNGYEDDNAKLDSGSGVAFGLEMAF